MKKVTIKKITLSEWKAQNISVEFSENENIITGDNGTGKTSIKKAWCWLLTGFSDPNTNKNSDLFDNKKELNQDTPTASVSAVIDVNGIEYELSRTATAKFVRKRGTDLYEKSASDEYHTYIDKVEMSSTNFIDWINQNICEDSYDVVQYLIDGDFFMKNCLEDKNKMRVFLGKIAGDVDESELKGDYRDLYSLSVEKKGIDNAAEYAKQMSISLKKHLAEIPTSIKTHQDTISDYKSRYNFAEIEEKISKNKEEIERIDGILFDKSNIEREEVNEINNRIDAQNAIKRKIEQEKYEYDKGNRDIHNKLVSELESAVRKNKYVEQRNKDAEENRKFEERKLKSIKEDVFKIESVISGLKEDLNNARSVSMAIDDENCPYCHQHLPEDMAEKNLEKFNLERQKKVDYIISKGKEAKRDLDETNKQISELEEKTSIPLKKEVEEDVSILEQNVSEFDASCIKFEDMERYKELMEELNKIVIPEKKDTGTEELVSKKKELQAEIDGLNRNLGAKDEIERINEKIACLNGEQTGTGIRIAEFENILIQLKKYNQEKSDIISSRLNRCLKYSNIQMFSFQKDGSLVPDLIIKDKTGVSYSTTNAANRIVMSVDVQHFLCEKLGIIMPIWIDEASIINPAYLPKFDTQYITMMYTSGELSINKK